MDTREHIRNRGLLTLLVVKFDIFGSAFNPLEDFLPSSSVSNGALSLLQDAEGNHCSSFPMPLLQLLHAGTMSKRSKPSIASTTNAAASTQEAAQDLLEAAQHFDPKAWALTIQPRSPAADLDLRSHIASAHRAATRIYLSRMLSIGDHDLQIPQDHASLVSEVIEQLSFILPADTLFAATAWPAFIAGAESRDTTGQDWARKHFNRLWEVQPWGLMKGAIAALELIWQSRDQREAQSKHDWIALLKDKRMNWLIL